MLMILVFIRFRRYAFPRVPDPLMRKKNMLVMNREFIPNRLVCPDDIYKQSRIARSCRNCG